MKYKLALLPVLIVAMMTTKAQTVQPLIDGQNYLFMAQSSLPLAGSERRLTINAYYLRITKEKIVSNLPYTGNATVANSDATANALNFTSSKFKYTITPDKKGGWRVIIRPRDAGYLDELKLAINPDGVAVLYATFNGLDNISYAGVVVDPGALAAR